MRPHIFLAIPRGTSYKEARASIAPNPGGETGSEWRAFISQLSSPLMKTKFLLLLLLTRAAFAAPVTVSGPTTYTQNFDTLPKTTGTIWSESTTIPGWRLYRDGASPPSANILASDGSGTWVAGLYSLGATNAADRALGAAPTTTHGTYHFMAFFQNTSGSPLKVSRIKYNTEVYRTNSVITTQTETLAFSRRIAANEAAITGALGTGWTADTSMDYTYPAQSVASSKRPPDVATVNKAPGTDIVVLPNEVLALRWSNANDGGEDAYMGIDDVEVQFASVGCTVSATVSNITRNTNGTPADPTDDTMSFNIIVSGFGTGNGGWKSLSGPSVTGTYGVSKAVTDVPVAQSPLTFTVADAITNTCATTTVVTVPAVEPAVSATNNVVISFTEPAVGAQSYVRTITSTEPGWSGGSAAAKVAVQPAPNGSAKYFDINSARPSLVTEGVNITGVTEFRASLDLAAYTTSTTGFEDADTFTATVQTATSINGPWTTVGTIINATNGVTLFNQIKTSANGINYPGSQPYPSQPFPFVSFRSPAIVRGSATHARIITSGGNDSTSEHTLIDNITFSPAVPTIYANYTVTRDNKMDDDLSNDEFYITATVTAELNGGNQFYQSNSFPVNAQYGTATNFGPFLVSAGVANLTFTDQVNPSLTKTLTVPPPATQLFYDIVNPGREGGITPSLSDDIITFRLTMDAINGGNGWTSNIPIPGQPGTFYAGNYGALYDIRVEVATMPAALTVYDRVDPTASLVLNTFPPPPRFVLGDILTLDGLGVQLITSTLDTQDNAWKNITNGVLTLNDSTIRDGSENGTPQMAPGLLSSEVIELSTVGEVDVTAELVVSETSASTNFGTQDYFYLKVLWDEQGLQSEANLIDPFDTDGNELLNGYSDSASLPYNNNRLKDEFNRPALAWRFPDSSPPLSSSNSPSPPPRTMR